MEPTSVPDDPRGTTLFETNERAAGADSEDRAGSSSDHRMAIGDVESVSIGTRETVVPRPSGPSTPAVFPLGEAARPDGAERARALRRVVRRRRWIRRATRAAVAALGAYLLVFNLSVVRGSSMAPGIHDGDRILIGQWSYLFDEVERGDVVVMRYPVDPRLDYIKRVIGLPGDEIRISGGSVYVNDERLDEPYVREHDADVHFYTRVRDDHYFVLGDNRPHSSDSREFGQVPRELLKGRVDLRVWPLSRLGWVR